MRRFSVLTCTPILAAIVCSTTASADVTAQQVWDNWSAQMGIYGEGFTTGDVTQTGDTLTVSDVRIEMTDDEASIVADVGDLILTEQGDGTVSMTMASSYPLTISVTEAPSTQPTILNVTVAQDGMEIIVSGDPDTMVYDLSADTYSFTLDTIEGAAAEEVQLEVAELVMSDMAGNYAVVTDDLTTVNYEFSLGGLNLNANISEAGGANRFKGVASMADLAMAATIAMPLDMDMDADVPPFDEGLAIEGGYTFGAVNYDLDFVADGEGAIMNAGVEGGEMGFAFGYDAMSYAGGADGISISMSLPQELPFPIEASLREYGFDFQIPLSQGEGDARDARMAFNFTDLAVSDTIWNLADPASVLPRDPVTIALTLDAKVTPFFDLLDPAQQDAMMMTDVPGELNSINITDLTLRGGGAEITGDGAFTFDNSDLTTFPGFPRPQGEANFTINGINGLIDNLITMGLIPQDQAMMPRMMLGMFATPVGDDMLTSTIGVNAQGHVLANGQRLR
ncbi:DUF2125 domain-containing protein [Pseudooctadecabacter jejudonensis]|uniref:DUF2125 domain-containing protein n=1 Tax=Pseudooctadecabacter jejudonensis TaxID=1391910 RepID=A0A1Y5S9G6_9RHOB|nr:DUF2125 domain-containing protein [Pseudooctadecabacter jejudonensis]SLN35243.1 hypothetical protein PSJ8397_01766 [Pseudooctadecabacter jejudonensis]